MDSVFRALADPTRRRLLGALFKQDAQTLSGLKKRLEETVEKVFEIYIKTPPERLWQAITDPEISPGSSRDPDRPRERAGVDHAPERRPRHADHIEHPPAPATPRAARVHAPASQGLT